MRWIALLLGLMLTASGCAMVSENASLRKNNERLQKEVTAAKMRADRLQRDLDYARKYPESLRVAPPSAPAKATPQPGKAAMTPRPASGAGKSSIVIGEAEMTAEAKASAEAEAKRLNALIAGVKAEYDLVGADSDRYAAEYNDLSDAIDKCRTTTVLYDQIVAPALDAPPQAPGAAAQARYDAVRAEEARRADEARRAQEEADQKREAAKAAQAAQESTAKTAAEAAAKAVEKNAPPPVMVVPGVIRTPVATPSPNGRGLGM
jgi:hypothetical protein